MNGELNITMNVVKKVRPTFLAKARMKTFLWRMSSLIKGKFEEADDYELGIMHVDRSHT